MSNFSKFNSKVSLPQSSDYESPFRLFSKVADQNLFNIIDHEQMRLAGSPLLIYKYHQANDVDDVYGEDRSKTLDVEPIRIYGHYDPKPVEENLTQFGIELNNDQQFTFNKSHVELKLGRSLIPGDVIKPEFQNLKYEIFEVQEDSFEMYGVYHLLCSARLLRDDQNIHNQIVNTSNEVKAKLDLED